jgi:hypothetical protein
MLPDAAASHEKIREYQEFIDHNELQLACEMLETSAADHAVSGEFWSALRDAAAKMQLLDHADRYGRLIP